MFSEGQRRRASLSILEKLRAQGAPQREESEDMNSMFAQVDEEGNVVPGTEEEEEKKKKKKKKTALPDVGEVPEKAAFPLRSLAGPA